MCWLTNITPDIGLAFGAALAARADDDGWAWTPERVSRLKALWRRGLAPGAIAEALGTVSGAVRSKAYRMQEAGELGAHPAPTAHQRGAVIGQATRRGSGGGSDATFWTRMAREDEFCQVILEQLGIWYEDDPRADQRGVVVWIRVRW